MKSTARPAFTRMLTVAVETQVSVVLEQLQRHRVERGAMCIAK